MREFLLPPELPAWHEVPDGLACDITLVFDEPPFSVRSIEETAAGTSIHLEWSGEGTALNDLARDFFHRYAGCFERTNFIHQELQTDCFLVQIVAGNETHGHFVEVRVTGSAFDRVREHYLRAGGKLAK